MGSGLLMRVTENSFTLHGNFLIVNSINYTRNRCKIDKTVCEEPKTQKEKCLESSPSHFAEKVRRQDRPARQQDSKAQHIVLSPLLLLH